MDCYSVFWVRSKRLEFQCGWEGGRTQHSLLCLVQRSVGARPQAAAVLLVLAQAALEVLCGQLQGGGGARGTRQWRQESLDFMRETLRALGGQLHTIAASRQRRQYGLPFRARIHDTLG